MKADIKQLWIDALRSGEFKKTRGALKRVIGKSSDHEVCHCALGVLCELYLKHTGEAVWEPGRNPRPIYDNESLKVIGTENSMIFKPMYTIIDGRAVPATFGTTSEIPNKVQEWAGLRGPDPVITYDENGNELTMIMLNDSEDKSFEEIAEIIEQEL